MKKSRRTFIRNSALVTGSMALGSNMLLASCSGNGKKVAEDMKDVVTNKKKASDVIKLSLAQWSLHNALFKKEMDNLDFAAKSKKLGFAGIEYVNQFFKDKAQDAAYLKEMNMRASDAGVEQLLIMVDGEGGLALLNDTERNQAVENHIKWLDAAKALGCHSIRVNAYGEGSAEDVGAAAVKGLGKLSELAKPYGLNVIVENHGGYSSNGKWLANVMKQVNMDNCGTLPDFGNFCLERRKDYSCIDAYDKYQGMKDLMPYAKAVSAKSNNFGDDGEEIDIDYERVMRIVLDNGYEGFVGVEYEGKRMTEEEGIIATRDLIKKVLEKIG